MPYIAPPFTPSVTISGTDLIRNTDDKLQTIANDVGDYLEVQSQAMYTDLDAQMTVIEGDYYTVLKPEIEQKMDDLLSIAPDATYYTKIAIDSSLALKYDKVTQNWRDSMMSKAQFNALASERRANRAGSGFDELDTTLTSVNSGISTGLTPNTFTHGNARFSINGVINRYLSQSVIMPNAPTIYPYDATLTPEQIASGIIKHADSSNSGLIVNGKFDVGTSGWTATNGTISVSSNKLLLTNGTSLECQAYQSFTTVIGKKYTLEIYNEDGTSLTNGIKVGTAINGSTLVNLSNVASTTRSQVDFIATATTTFITLTTGTTTTGQTALFDNIAVYPADAISRSDLVFLESWHEDVSEKDFVYPLGNVQYLGTTGDSGAPVVGAFAGSATYSLFSDTWQADGALVGKGYVWSTLSDANKKAFVSNSENNCYLDGDKVIQVRYRMRVVAGMGDSWVNVDPQSGYLLLLAGLYVRPKGKQSVHTQGDTGYGADANGVYGNNLVTWTNLLPWNDNGVWVGADAYGDTNGYLPGSYNGQIFALPIALVHR